MDLINSIFELLGALFILDHCRILYTDKMVRGVSILAVAFMFGWAVWNIFYYPSLGQKFSFYAGVFMCIANCVWIWLTVYYKRKEKARRDSEYNKRTSCC